VSAVNAVNDAFPPKRGTMVPGFGATASIFVIVRVAGHVDRRFWPLCPAGICLRLLHDLA